MKTQRRHQLESNKLAEWISKNAEQYKSHARTIMILVVGAVAIFFAALVYRNSRAASDGAAWRSFYSAFTTERSSPEALIEVASTYEDSNVSPWAKLSAADAQLAQGMTRLYTDRDQALTFLKDAEKNLKDVEASASDHPVVLERARFALAQTYESLSDVEQARKYYGLVASARPDSALGKVAAKRSEALTDPKLAEFYAWFAEQEPKVPQITPSGAGSSPLGAGARESLKNLPKTSDLPSLEKQFALPPSTTKEQPKSDSEPALDPPADSTQPDAPADQGASPDAPAPPSTTEPPAENGQDKGDKSEASDEVKADDNAVRDGAE